VLKRLLLLLLLVLGLVLQGCVSPTAGLASYVDNGDGYQFLYPLGWVPVSIKNGPDVVLHDLIEETENISVIINAVPEGKTLQDLGNPVDVGYRLSKKAIAPPDSGRVAELVNAESHTVGNIVYYLLEYAVQLPTQKRHNFASVVVRRGQLFTLNLSTTENRWERKQDFFKRVVKSFSVY